MNTVNNCKINTYRWFGEVIPWLCAGTGAVLGVLKNLQGLRNEMAHLCTNLQAYLMFEVLERAWTQFTAQIAAAPDLDSLIGAPPPVIPLRGYKLMYLPA